MAEATPIKIPDQVQLALERNFLALERTLMAWVRTSTSLITFGFGLYKLFYYLREQDPAKYTDEILGARTLGLLMIVIGVLLLALATWQHRQRVKLLRAQYTDAPLSLSLVAGALITILGLVAILAAVFRV